jgi:hypothetical protein
MHFMSLFGAPSLRGSCVGWGFDDGTFRFVSLFAFFEWYHQFLTLILSLHSKFEQQLKLEQLTEIY